MISQHLPSHIYLRTTDGETFYYYNPPGVPNVFEQVIRQQKMYGGRVEKHRVIDLEDREYDAQKLFLLVEGKRYTSFVRGLANARNRARLGHATIYDFVFEAVVVE